jgi:excinuclease ABC subunit A
LARELSKEAKGHVLYILDEPTTGLHFSDINQLLKTIDIIKNQNHSLIIIEHNLDIIKNADHIIDMGPYGGVNGGNIIAEGRVEDIIRSKVSLTGKYLKEHIEQEA